MSELENTCRVCRGGEEEGELLQPCFCSGTMSFIHEPCLTSWLAVSRKNQCEVCGGKFEYTEVYAPDMPPHLPLSVALRHLAYASCSHLLSLLRYALVIVTWLIVVPLIVISIYNALVYSADSAGKGTYSLLNSPNASVALASLHPPRLPFQVQLDRFRSVLAREAGRSLPRFTPRANPRVHFPVEAGSSRAEPGSFRDGHRSFRGQRRHIPATLQSIAEAVASLDAFQRTAFVHYAEKLLAQPASPPPPECPRYEGDLSLFYPHLARLTAPTSAQRWRHTLLRLLSGPVLSGQILTVCMIVLFLAVFLLREWVFMNGPELAEEEEELIAYPSISAEPLPPVTRERLRLLAPTRPSDLDVAVLLLVSYSTQQRALPRPPVTWDAPTNDALNAWVEDVMQTQVWRMGTAGRAMNWSELTRVNLASRGAAGYSGGESGEGDAQGTRASYEGNATQRTRESYGGNATQPSYGGQASASSRASTSSTLGQSGAAGDAAGDDPTEAGAVHDSALVPGLPGRPASGFASGVPGGSAYAGNNGASGMFGDVAFAPGAPGRDIAALNSALRDEELKRERIEQHRAHAIALLTAYARERSPPRSGASLHRHRLSPDSAESVLLPAIITLLDRTPAALQGGAFDALVRSDPLPPLDSFVGHIRDPQLLARLISGEPSAARRDNVLEAWQAPYSYWRGRNAAPPSPLPYASGRENVWGAVGAMENRADAEAAEEAAVMRANVFNDRPERRRPGGPAEPAGDGADDDWVDEPIGPGPGEMPAAAAPQNFNGLDEPEIAEFGDNIDDILQIIGARGPLTTLPQHAILLVLLVAAALAVAFWFPLLLGKGLSGLGMSRVLAPFRLVRAISDPVCEFVAGAVVWALSCVLRGVIPLVAEALSRLISLAFSVESFPLSAETGVSTGAGLAAGTAAVAASVASASVAAASALAPPHFPTSYTRTPEDLIALLKSPEIASGASGEFSADKSLRWAGRVWGTVRGTSEKRGEPHATPSHALSDAEAAVSVPPTQTLSPGPTFVSPIRTLLARLTGRGGGVDATPRKASGEGHVTTPGKAFGEGHATTPGKTSGDVASPAQSEPSALFFWSLLASPQTLAALVRHFFRVVAYHFGAATLVTDTLHACVAIATANALFVAAAAFLNAPDRNTNHWYAVFYAEMATLLSATKVALFLTIEVLLFPAMCGFCIVLSTLPLFPDASLASRITLFRAAPFPCLFLTWLGGTAYMFSFSILIDSLRSVFRKGVVWFVRDPSAPDFYPVKEILEKPAITQLKKITYSAATYLMCIFVSLGLPFYTLRYIVPGGILPLNYGMTSVLSLPLDIAVARFVLTRTLFSPAFNAWIDRTVARQLRNLAALFRMSDVLFGEHSESQEKPSTSLLGRVADWSAYLLSPEQKPPYIEGGYARVPAVDSVKIVPDRKVFVPATRDGLPYTVEDAQVMAAQIMEDWSSRPKDRYRITYVPPYLRTRVTLFISCAWGLFVGALTLAFIGPLLLGRVVTEYAYGGPTYDIYAFFAGLLLIRLGFFIRAEVRDASSLARLFQPKANAVVLQALTAAVALPIVTGAVVIFYGWIDLRGTFSLGPTKTKIYSPFFVWCAGSVALQVGFTIFKWLKPGELTRGANFFYEVLNGRRVINPLNPRMGAFSRIDALDVLLKTVAFPLLYQVLLVAVLPVVPLLFWTVVTRQPMANADFFRYAYRLFDFTIFLRALLLIRGEIWEVVDAWQKQVRQSEYMVARRLLSRRAPTHGQRVEATGAGGPA